MERVIKDDIRLDKLDLANEAEKLASLYHYWADVKADKERIEDEAKDNLNKISADKTLYYWANPKKRSQSNCRNY